ncbi:MAG: quinone-dependent dihydroorotate dehydrogenase [Sphingomonadales bacterium]|nr:quinone-dependent dihydroorotate dehydrogenase [Sphingomonadales bacterium]
MLYALARPLIFLADAERAHDATIALLAALPAARRADTTPRLATTVAGIAFPNPVGLAPGFDKDARAAHAMARFGFGFAEVGTLTPRAQPGNPRPRLFRLGEDQAVINRLGFNNRGQDDAVARLRALRRARCAIPIGINIGANKANAAGDAAIADYRRGVAAMAPFADYLTINISSPNTPGLRALQDKGALDALLGAVIDARGRDGPPVFLKVAPDLDPADIDDIVALAHAHRLGALIVANTTIARPRLASRHAHEAGGLSGAPLHDLALQRLRDFRRAGSGDIALIGVGGIADADQAYARIRAGASLVQLYSAMVYRGPGLARRIAAGLDRRLARDGFADVAAAVGSEA